MTMVILTSMLAVLAALPLVMFAMNTWLYRRLPMVALVGSENHQTGDAKVSLLIPARNEEAGIAPCVQAAQASVGVELEIVIMDDQSTDATARIVRQLADEDARVHLLSAPPLPAGWCGKQHACYQLAQAARHEIMVWIDADVRLQPDALARLAQTMQKQPRTALLSGVPGQITGSFLEHLLIPLIHVVLLGYLPMFMMKRSSKPNFSAGCGQLFVARRSAYLQCGGHSDPLVRGSLHDGVKLPRAFRQHGLHTDLCDATDLAGCRMYQGAAQTWKGLAKNATEGMASAAAIVPWSLLLIGGHVLPWLGLLMFDKHSLPARLCLIAVMCTMAMRGMIAARFQQSAIGVIFHPLSVLLLVMIQWYALLRAKWGRPSDWKGRAYLAGG